ncbi:MAG: SDR family NAD(P)-dependent oxidoreductase [Anaerolineae bacterium]|nr:MAG: SDR family NAD(P)-dependent oxidoreductase [Anaerolineae bacterium]
MRSTTNGRLDCTGSGATLMTEKKQLNLTETPLVQRPRAIVVGASSGIGAALARRLAAEGYALALLGRRAGQLEELAAAINRSAGQTVALAYPHDVTHYDEIPALFQQIVAALGRLDLLAYVAGVMPPLAPNEYNFEKARQTVEVNLLGAIAWLDQAAMLFQRQGSGQIVGVSSIAGDRGRVAHPPYHATKAGLSTYLESLRNRLAKHGVHVLTVKPGFVDTEMLAGASRTFWVIPPAQAAGDIWKAIRRRRQVVYTPARWRLIALTLIHIPSFIFRRLSF